MTKVGSWVGLLLLLLVSACAPNPVECDLHVVTTMPLEVRNRLLIVTAGIDGKWVRLLVDTGAERTAISKEAADRLGLARDQENMTKMTGVGGTYTAHDAIIPGLVLGGVFFGGLWWTVQKGFASPRPALWFLGSLLLRRIAH